jgi:hypothetical protein
MARKLQKLAKLSPRERVIVAQLIFFSSAATVALRLVRLPRLIRFITRYALKPWARRLPIYHDGVDARRLAHLVDLATTVTHGHGRCLARSLALFWLLKARGEQPELLIGVRKEATALRSHAWIVSQGTVMSDSQELTTSFAPLLRF